MIGLDELKEYIGLTDNAADEVLEALEQRAVAFVEQFTGRSFSAASERTVYESGTGTRVLWLDETPEADPAPVISVEGPAGTWTVVPDTDYVIRDKRLVHNTCWACGWENYKIMYTAGYIEGDEPGDVRQVVIELVAFKYSQRGTAGFKGETISKYSYTLADAADSDALSGSDTVATLESWRWVRV